MTDPVTPLDPQQTAQEEKQTAAEDYPRRVLVAGDIFLNVLRGGPQDVTISTSAALAARKGNEFGKILSEFLDVFQRDHGADAAAGDMERAEQAQQQIDNSNLLDHK